MDHKNLGREFLAPELEKGLSDILARGGCIFPICPDSKRPLPAKGEDIGKPGFGGYKLATNDPRVVWNYFRGDQLPNGMPEAALKLLMAWRRTESPNAAIALDMSGMLVLDADSLDELNAFTSRYGDLPKTYCVRSPRTNGGMHFYFMAKPKATYRRNISGFPHLDIKHHGYVLIPGSVKRDSGGEIVGRYSVVDDSPIADLPDNLRSLMEKPSRISTTAPSKKVTDDEWGASLNEWVIQRARAYLAKMPPAISGHGGHNATFLAARALVCGFALDEDDAFDLLVSDYNQRCEPPWAEWELRHKVRSAINCSTTPIGYLLDAHKDGYDDWDDANKYEVKPFWD